MIRIGIICPSEIAFRRFMPALQKLKDVFVFAGISIASPLEWFGDISSIPEGDITQQQQGEKEKALRFIELYGGKIYSSYYDLINADDVDAVYIPLPPALHYKWASAALHAGKHVLVEKPSTISFEDSMSLVSIARERNLSLHENYMFLFHDQIQAIRAIINKGELGDVRLFRIAFGFPMRGKNDFRYKKALGGGALIDCGGYTFKLADHLLGGDSDIVDAHLNYLPNFEVDMYGSAVLRNSSGVTAQVAFGMDCGYKCELEVWGSQGTLRTNRVLTAPVGYTPTCEIVDNDGVHGIELPEDDAFMKSIAFFGQSVISELSREESYKRILRQANLVQQFISCKSQSYHL